MEFTYKDKKYYISSGLEEINQRQDSYIIQAELYSYEENEEINLEIFGEIYINARSCYENGHGISPSYDYYDFEGSRLECGEIEEISWFDPEDDLKEIKINEESAIENKIKEIFHLSNEDYIGFYNKIIRIVEEDNEEDFYYWLNNHYDGE